MCLVLICKFANNRLKNGNAAQYLTGYITYAKDELGKKNDMYPVKFIMYENPKKNNKSTDKEKSKYEEYREALRDFKANWLSKIGKS